VRVFRCESSFFGRPATLIGLLGKKSSRVSDFLGTCDALALHQQHFGPSPATLGPFTCYTSLGRKCTWRGVMAFPAQYIISGLARGRFCCKWMKGLECEDSANQNRFGRKFAGPVYDTTTTDEHAIGLGGKNSNL